MSIVQSVSRAYRRGGLTALIAGVRRRHKLFRRRIHWTNWGRSAVFIAKHLPPLSPPLLILSLPRSGSSWVGETLGRAPEAMYLREPFTQSRGEDDPFAYDAGEWAFDTSPDRQPAKYWQMAEFAFIGLPWFQRSSVVFPEQWSLMGRVRRRLVIKEVRSLINIWLVPRYRPRVIFLVRHPAAVALSYKTLGWGQFNAVEKWRQHGEFQAHAQRIILDRLLEHPDYRVITYETLCADPLSQFKALFEFTQLTWTAQMEQHIQDRTMGEIDNEARHPYDLNRNSRRMIDSWRSRINAEELWALRMGYNSFTLPWYASDADW